MRLPRGHAEIALLWILLAIYVTARITQAFPDRIPVLFIVALHVLPALFFALIHGSIAYRVRGILVFVLLCLLWGNLSETLSLRTGFPFGRYHFTDVMGPKLFQVPVLLGLAYIGIGYVSWTLARLIVRDNGIVTVPSLAALIMVGWDLSMDPVWSNLGHAWVWHDGGLYFGVPLSNFFGWYLTVYLIYQSFALYLRRSPTEPRTLPAGFWRLAVIFYGVCAAGNLLVRPPADLAAGMEWRVSSILMASAAVSIVVMGGFAVLAWMRAEDRMSA